MKELKTKMTTTYAEMLEKKYGDINCKDKNCKKSHIEIKQ